MLVLDMMRSMVALFIISFVFLFVSFWTGVAGCWRRSSGNITSTAVLMLLTCLFSAGGMGLWHGVEYYATYKLNEEPYPLSWDQVSYKHISSFTVVDAENLGKVVRKIGNSEQYRLLRLKLIFGWMVKLTVFLTEFDDT